MPSVSDLIEMAHAARYVETSASRSPLLGGESIFCDHMVTLSGEVDIKNIRKHFPDTTYTLNALTQFTPQGSNEGDAKRWIESMFDSRSGFSALENKGLLHSSELAPFHSTSLIKPDVSVVTSGRKPLFTVEVYSDTYERTVKKALIGAITHFRILRAYNSRAESCIAFAFPGNKPSQDSCVTKVIVSFVNFRFQYRFLLLKKDEVKPTIREILRQDWSCFSGIPDFSFFVRFSQEECDVFVPGAVQVSSTTSSIVRNRECTKYWKFTKKESTKFVQLTVVAINGGSHLQYSLLPSSISQQGFLQYDGLKPPLSREEAKSHLLPLVEGVRVALDELHFHSIAHMDVRLPNICFTHSSPSYVKLIDLDRCEVSHDPIRAMNMYADTDMYSPKNFTWQNYQLDWKALGMVICFILDDGVDERDYHCMISDGKVSNGVDGHQFVKSLLEGEWNDVAWYNFQSQYQNGHNCPL